MTHQYILPIAHELIVDLFAGGGGASCGIEAATGRHVDIAVNHDAAAVSLHQANHPQARHFCSDVFEVDPRTVTDGQPIGLLWASPDCTYHSKARGGKPHRDRARARRRRGLANVVIKWVRLLQPTGQHPRVIALENVEEFQHWGPLLADGTPCPDRRGSSFHRWVAELRNLGYAVEWRELRACDYGTPTIRKRLFLIARRDGEPIVWPTPTHADQKHAKPRGLKPWRTAAECIDWTIPCPSIFDRKRPLAEATMRRIAHGLKRYVIDAAQPFIVPVTHQGANRVHAIGDPLRTVTTAQRGEFALCVPTLIKIGYGESPGQTPRAPGLHKPLGTVVGAHKHALVTAFIAKHYTGVTGHGLQPPLGTVTTSDHHSLVTSLLVKLRNTSNSASCTDPLATITAGGTHHAEVRALLIKFYGSGGQLQSVHDPLHTIPTHDRLALVTVHGEDYVIADIGMRMLQPRELYRAQGFPDSYVIDHGADGRVMTKAEQVRMCGNSVCPPLAEALVRANYADQAANARRAA